MSQTATHNPTDIAARAILAEAVQKSRRLQGIRGDELIVRHDAAAGKALADRARDGFAAEIASVHAGDRDEFYRRVKGAVPSAKPCRMAPPGCGTATSGRTSGRGTSPPGDGIACAPSPTAWGRTSSSRCAPGRPESPDPRSCLIDPTSCRIVRTGQGAIA